jgi:Spy/CpxP family protein refolding chaperone
MSLLSSRSKAILIALAIFVLGMLFGSTMERWMGFASMRPGGRNFSRWGDPPMGEKGGPRGHERMLHRFSNELDLTEEQKEKMKFILDESREKMEDVRRQAEENMRPVLKESKTRIREVLTPEQQEQYDKISKRMDKRMHRGRRPRGRPRDP